jgi:hypothetical protein
MSRLKGRVCLAPLYSPCRPNPGQVWAPRQYLGGGLAWLVLFSYVQMPWVSSFQFECLRMKVCWKVLSRLCVYSVTDNTVSHGSFPHSSFWCRTWLFCLPSTGVPGTQSPCLRRSQSHHLRIPVCPPHLSQAHVRKRKPALSRWNLQPWMENRHWEPSSWACLSSGLHRQESVLVLSRKHKRKSATESRVWSQCLCTRYQYHQPAPMIPPNRHYFSLCLKLLFLKSLFHCHNPTAFQLMLQMVLQFS